MSILEEMGDRLARKAIEAEVRFEDPTIPEDISKAIGATSTTLQEAYLTALRIHRAANRAEKLLDDNNEGRLKGIKVVSTESRLEDDPSTTHGSSH
jgi:hypothetical protein